MIITDRDNFIECLNKFELKLIDSCVLFCQRCGSIILGKNIRYHLRKIHNAHLSSSETSQLVQMTLNQAGSCYVQLAQGTSLTGVNVERFRMIEYLPKIQGFRCSKCNYGGRNHSELCSRHAKFQGSRCAGNGDCFEESRVQIVRIGGKFVGFGVIEEVISGEGIIYMSELEYQSARRIIADQDQGRRSGIDSVESQLYQSLGWFRKNSDGTDFLDFGTDILQRVSQFRLPEPVSIRLFNFFKERISAVSECPADIRLLLSDEKFMTIRPIIDQHKSYAKYFVEIFRIVIALVSLQVVNVAPEGIYREVERQSQFLLLSHQNNIQQGDEGGEYTFDDLNGLWEILVDQSINLIGNDFLKLVIRFKCFNPETGKLSRSSAVEQMAAKSFYFCRLQKLNCIMNASVETLPIVIKAVQDYFKANDTPFHRLCYLKGLAGDISESEEVNPVIASSHDPTVFTVAGIQMSPAFLNTLYLGLVADFRTYLDQLLLGFEIDVNSFSVTDNHTDHSFGTGMRATDDYFECFLISQLFRENGPINSRFMSGTGNDLN